MSLFPTCWQAPRFGTLSQDVNTSCLEFGGQTVKVPSESTRISPFLPDEDELTTGDREWAVFMSAGAAHVNQKKTIRGLLGFQGDVPHGGPLACSGPGSEPPL